MLDQPVLGCIAVHAHDRRQHLAGPDLEQHVIGLAKELLDTVREAHRLPQVAAQYAGSVACSAVIQVPVTFET